MYQDEKRFAVTVVSEAAALGRRVQQSIAASGDSLTKNDRSPVTVADLAIQAVISHRLQDFFPGDLLLAEESSDMLRESPDTAAKVLDLVSTVIPDADTDSIAAALDRGDHRGDAERYWVLDPVDGTKGFLRGEHYAVALALVVEGQVTAGVLGCPNMTVNPPLADAPVGALFSAVRGQGSEQHLVDGTTVGPITVDSISDASQAAFCESVEAAHAAHGEQAEIARRLGITRPSYRIDSQCKYGVVARGEASIYLRLPSKKGYREKVWDHAAGAIVIEEAGGRVSNLEGEPLDFSAGRLLANGRGIVATNGLVHDRVLAVCREVLEAAGS